MTTTSTVRLERPSSQDIEKTFKRLFLQSWEWISDPVMFGMENIPNKGPLLFVGNHTVLGLLDIAVMWINLYRKNDIYLRTLGDHVHFNIPFWRDLVAKFGVVDGNRKNCTKLMDAGESILVFPGGSRESFKYKGEKYKLLWGERLGFARMAIKHGCTIIPFSAVGGEECFDLVVDAKQVLKSPIGKMMKRLKMREDWILPWVKGIGITPIPRPERFYYSFGKPISTAEFNGDFSNDELCRALKATVKTAVEDGIEQLCEHRKQDPKRKLVNRLIDKFNLNKALRFNYN